MLGPGPGGSGEQWRGLKRWCCNQGCVLKIRISRHTVGLIAGHCYLPKCHPPLGHHLAPVWLELQWNCLKIEAIPTHAGKSPHSECLLSYPMDIVAMEQRCVGPALPPRLESWCFPSQVTLGKSFHFPCLGFPIYQTGIIMVPHYGGSQEHSVR